MAIDNSDDNSLYYILTLSFLGGAILGCVIAKCIRHFSLCAANADQHQNPGIQPQPVLFTQMTTSANPNSNNGNHLSQISIPTISDFAPR